MSATQLLLVSLCTVPPLFLGIYLLGLRLRNFGIVDVAWAGGFAPVAVFYALQGAGGAPQRLLTAALACAWSLRLAGYLGLRVASHHPQEDGRYATLRREWADHLHLKMGGFFVAQGLLIVVLSLPFALVASQAQGPLGTWEFAAVTLFLLALAGESIADAQLRAFKANPAMRGRVCDRGLWGWSRHPNYFFEALVWVSFALLATPLPNGWLAWLSPLLISWFLTRVTGIRYTEEQLLQSKGAAYRDYQQRTSAFIPWPPRRTSS